MDESDSCPLGLQPTSNIHTGARLGAKLVSQMGYNAKAAVRLPDEPLLTGLRKSSELSTVVAPIETAFSGVAR